MDVGFSMKNHVYQTFARLKGVEPVARYLLCLMIEKGLIGVGLEWQGGISKLAEAVGHNKTKVSRGLKTLVGHKILAKGKKMTRGRPVETYRLSIRFSAMGNLTLTESVCMRILNSESKAFSQLSISERCLLAQLWVASGNLGEDAPAIAGGESSALIRVSAVTLAEDVGLHESTVRRLLSMLGDEGFISCVNTDFPRSKILSRENVYFLLGPSTVKDFPAKRVSTMDLSGVLGWFAGNSGSGSDELTRVCGFNLRSAKHRYADMQLLGLDDAAFKWYLLICLCVVLSGNRADAEGDLKRVIGSALKEFFQIDDKDSFGASEGGSREPRLIESLLDRITSQLQGEVLQLFSAKDIFSGEPLLGVSCYPVGRPGSVRLQVNSICLSNSALKE